MRPRAPGGTHSSQAGFTLVELLVALVILQVGLLATAGMIFLAQENLARGELLIRATLEAGRLADSLGGRAGGGTGELALPWGTLRWGPAPGGAPGLRVVALALGGKDTLAMATRWAPPPDTLLWRPDGPGGGTGP